MRVNEKTLELNVGAEILSMLRMTRGHKAYLRGLTQAEEKLEGIDFFARLPDGTRLYIFQFKAPAASTRSPTFDFRVQREQHSSLLGAATSRGIAYYAFPYYSTYPELHAGLPRLAADTWLLDVNDVAIADFGPYKSKTVRCQGSTARVNPEYGLAPLGEGPGRNPIRLGSGIPAEQFDEWYRRLRRQRDTKARGGRLNSWLVRGMRAAVVIP